MSPGETSPPSVITSGTPTSKSISASFGTSTPQASLPRWMRQSRAWPKAWLKRLEGQRGQRAHDPRHVGDMIVDELADVFPVLDVDLHQEVVFAAGRIKLRRDLALEELVGDL